MKVSGLQGENTAGLDAEASGAAKTGTENEELNWGRRHMGGDDNTVPQIAGETGHVRVVERVTALHDIGPAPGQEPVPAKKLSRDTRGAQIRSCDDDTVRCRQARELSDRLEEVTEALLLLINDLQYRMDDLEGRRHVTAQPADGIRPGEKP